MATIPKNQKTMHALIDEIVLPTLFPRPMLDICSDLRACVLDLSRRPRFTRAPTVSRPVTPAIKAQMRDLHERNPDMTYQQIAVVLGIDKGRVSEVLAGKRT